MLLVKDKIWCAFRRDLHIYNTNSMIIKRVKFDIERVWVYEVHAHMGRIILASSIGVLEMLESGEYVMKIEGGHLNAICMFKKKLYATHDRSPVLLGFFND